MTEDIRGDVQINGSGSAGGGRFGNVRINGSGAINGDLDCLEFTGNGTATINGTLTAQTVGINGSSKVQGALHADTLKVNGTAEVLGDATVKTLEIRGTANVHGNVAAESVILRGALQVKDDCNAETFDAKGGFTIGGLLNAGKMTIRLHGDCRAREIGGASIDVKQEPSLFGGISKLFHSLINLPHGLYVDTIEGDDITLEATTAKVVRGKRVTIGAGCEIDLVEYSECYHPAEEAKVKEQRQI